MTDTDYREKARGILLCGLNSSSLSFDEQVDLIAAFGKQVAEEAERNVKGVWIHPDDFLRLNSECGELRSKLAALLEPVADEKVREALAAVDDMSDGSKHDWRKFAHDLARALRAKTAALDKAQLDVAFLILGEKKLDERCQALAASLTERETVTIPGLRNELEIQRGNVGMLTASLNEAEAKLARVCGFCEASAEDHTRPCGNCGDDGHAKWECVLPDEPKLAALEKKS